MRTVRVLISRISTDLEGNKPLGCYKLIPLLRTGLAGRAATWTGTVRSTILTSLFLSTGACSMKRIFFAGSGVWEVGSWCILYWALPQAHREGSLYPGAGNSRLVMVQCFTKDSQVCVRKNRKALSESSGSAHTSPMEHRARNCHERFRHNALGFSANTSGKR